MPYYNIRQVESVTVEYLVHAENNNTAKAAVEAFRDGVKNGAVTHLRTDTDTVISVCETTEKEWLATGKSKPARKKK